MRITKLKRPAVQPNDSTKPQNWKGSGDRLWASAEVLWTHLSPSLQGDTVRSEEANHYGGFFLLASLAVENRLKGRLVRLAVAAGRGPTDAKEVQKLVGANHDLLSLAKKAGLTLQAAEEKLLERLTEFSVWSAKYPGPLAKQQMKDPRRTSRSTDRDEIGAILRKIDAA